MLQVNNPGAEVGALCEGLSRTLAVAGRLPEPEDHAVGSSKMKRREKPKPSIHSCELSTKGVTSV